MLRQQDQQRMQELQHTLVELEREEKEMSAQRLRQHNIAASSQHLQSDFQTGSAQHNQQVHTWLLLQWNQPQTPLLYHL